MVEVPFIPLKGAEGSVEHLDDAHAVDILHHRPLHPLLGVVEFHLEGRLVGLFQAGGEQYQRNQNRQQGHNCQPPVHAEQVQQGEDRRSNCGRDLAEVVRQKRLDLVGVIGDHLLDGSLGRAGEKSGGDAGELLHQLQPQVVDNLIGRRMGKCGGDEGAQAVDQRRAKGDCAER